MRRLRRLRASQNLRDMVRENSLAKSDLIYPLFIVEAKQSVKKEIQTMPGVFQMSVDAALSECEALLKLGINHVLLFGIPAHKDEIGSSALSDKNIVCQAISAIKKRFPEMLITADLCFCEYTSHGHCGILDAQGSVDNDATLKISGEQAVVLAAAGADIIAPSGMMDGIVATLREYLDAAKHHATPIMSYSTKFASAFYGPFRDVAESAPSHGDRRGYQMDPANRREAILESLEDDAQGADILMIKPALAYMDIIREVRERTLLPLAVYNVSGEYAMLKFAARAGAIDYERALMEMMLGFKRAGADIIITYHAKEVAELL